MLLGMDSRPQIRPHVVVAFAVTPEVSTAGLRSMWSDSRRRVKGPQQSLPVYTRVWSWLEEGDPSSPLCLASSDWLEQELEGGWGKGGCLSWSDRAEHSTRSVFRD